MSAAAAATLWRRTLQLGPWLTDTIGLAATQPSPALQLLIVPGNPGLATFYSAFIQELHAAFDGAASVWAASHVGHDDLRLAGGATFCLDTQVAHKAALLRHALGPGQPPTVVLAHSIGSWMVLRALQQHLARAEQQQLVKVVLLMPFLACDWASPRQRLLRAASWLAPAFAAVAGLVGSLPAALQHRLVALAEPGTEPHARRSMLGLMSRAGVHNNLHLAWHEFRDLDTPAPWHLIEQLGSAAAVVAAPDDLWHPEQHFRELTQQLPHVEAHWCHELKHAFCLWRSQCQRVASLVADLVRRSHQALGPAGVSGSGAVDAAVVLEDAPAKGADEAATPQQAARHACDI